MNAVAFFDPQSQRGVSGTVRFSQQTPNDVVTVSISLSGFQPHQTHAIHIHEYGDLTGGCATTGKHLNPFGDTHGSPYFPAHPRHAGDLINNIVTDQEGCVVFAFSDNQLSLDPTKPNGVVGRAVVIHSYTDDYGLGGVLEKGALVPYSEMPLRTLQRISKERGYPSSASKAVLVEKLRTESLQTGNAGGRMACAVIGLAA
jgi:Cu-Zn family superoxide dismutase